MTDMDTSDPRLNTAFSVTDGVRDRDPGLQKVWIVPFPYDYCRLGELLVRADTPEDALALARRIVDSGQLDHPIFGGGNLVTPAEAANVWAKVSLSKVKEWTSQYYFNGGCDQ